MPTTEYHHYDVRREREYISGKVAMPTSGGGPVAPQLHAPIEYCLVTYVVAAFNDWPLVPSPASLGINFDLIDSKEVAVFPSPTGSTRLFTTYGYYAFLNTRPTGPGTDLATGKVPGDNLPQGQSILRQTNYRLGILAQQALSISTGIIQ